MTSSGIPIGVVGSQTWAANGGTISSAMNALLFAAEDGKAFFNIHSTAFPGGEIRGLLTDVPEPTSIFLTGGVLVGMVLRRRRSQFIPN